MRKFIYILGISLVIIVLSLLTAKKYLREKKQDTVSVEVFKKNIKEPIPEVMTFSPAVKISEGCREKWNALLGMDLNNYGVIKDNGTIYLSEADEGRLLGHIENILVSSSCSTTHLRNEYFNNLNTLGAYCERANNSLGNREESFADEFKNCFLALIKYRSAAAEVMTRDKPLEEIGDIAILSNKLIYSIDTGALDNVSKIAGRMLEIEPDNVFVAGKLLQATWLRYFLNKNEEQAESDLEEVIMKYEPVFSDEFKETTVNEIKLQYAMKK